MNGKPRRNRQVNEANNINGETFVKLNGLGRERNSSLILSAKSSRGDKNANAQPNREFVRLSQNVAATFTFVKTALAMTSEGQLTYGDVIPTDRLFYSMQQNVSESECCRNTNMQLRFGRGTRSFEIDGVWSDSKTSLRLQDDSDKSRRLNTKALHASLFWDADKDRNKCLTFHSVLGTGDGTSLDVTLASPVTDQVSSDYHCVSRDHPVPPHINNIEDLLLNKKESTHKALNYTAFLRLEHPFSDLDLGLMTRVSGEESGFKGGVELWYMTTLRQRKYVSLQSYINNLDREVQVQVRTPGHSWTARANLSSSFHLTLSAGRHDVMHANVVMSEMTIDRHQRSVIMTVACDSAENSDNVLTLEGKYINDSTINVVLRHRQLIEGLLSIRLNTSTLLHTHLYWRPESITAFKEMTISSLINAELHMRQALKGASQAVRNELASRYLRYDFIRSGGDLLTKAGRHLDQMLYTLHTHIIQEQLQLRALRVVDSVKARARDGTRTLHSLLLLLDQRLQEVSQRMASQFLMNFNDEEKRMNCSGSLNYKIFPWTVTSKVKSAFSKIASTVSALKLYYQVKGTWLEDNLKIFQSMGSSLASMALTLKKVVSSELSHSMRHFQCPWPSRITVWLPQDGEVQAEMCLPVPLQSLDALPDVADYVTSVFSAVVSYYTQSSTARETLINEKHDSGAAHDEC
ncbi:hypothetical protein C0Q70_02401 [Pomacea canaliculata]|uniref:Uncharacterized protein n=1 Tax=Pomacea canaliculata TaxID=400727 RepID=A0A2T7PPT7_POMCA|nr:hypothetical protein C0Q70_02401 [Pomacea canaliculata]